MVGTLAYAILARPSPAVHSFAVGHLTILAVHSDGSAFRIRAHASGSGNRHGFVAIL